MVVVVVVVVEPVVVVVVLVEPVVVPVDVVVEVPVMALLGQTEAHFPHPVHFDASITAFPPEKVKAP